MVAKTFESKDSVLDTSVGLPDGATQIDVNGVPVITYHSALEAFANSDAPAAGQGGEGSEAVVQDPQTYQNTSGTRPAPGLLPLSGGDLSDLEDNEF